MSANESEDWIELFLDWTEGIPSPRIFRQWAAICTLAGALERRVHIVSAGKTLFPNMYVLLVGTPGVGKTQVIEHVNDLWHVFTELHVAPHDVTKAALIDCLAQASSRRVLGESELLEYNSLLVAADEFGVLVPSHDLEFLSTLNRIFDNPPQHRQNRRGLQQQVDITNPQLNIVGGVQPAYLANLLPEEAWSMGFMSRVIMVFSGEKVKFKLNLRSDAKLRGNAAVRDVLISKTQKILGLFGRLDWTEEAENAVEKWNEGGLEPVPEHSKMEHYNQRRLLHVLKLCIISAVSRSSFVIDALDFNRARDWLFEVEQFMPDVFREMVQRSDRQVIDELHWYAWKLWVKDKQPIHEARLFEFLRIRAPSDKIPRILDIAVRAGMFENLGLNFYKPKPKHEHGME
jgi:hypothetical protein